MSITIPLWFFYIIGGVIGLGVLGLAALGILFIIAFWDFRGWR